MSLEHDGIQEERRALRARPVATGTLACPSCDAPLSLGAPRSPTAVAACAFCGHAGVVRDFLSLRAPSRPARVDVHVVGRLRDFSL